MVSTIKVQELKVSFGDLLVLDNISFTVAEGEIVALIGPSGCGKSTLLRIIAGIIPKMIKATLEGRVSVLGYNPEVVPVGIMDVIFQEENLLPWRDALGNVKLGVELLKGKCSDGYAIELLQLVGLSGFEKTRPRELSGGMRQRTALASALITSPKVFLMDEPFGSLDALTREGMWEVLEGIRQQEEAKVTTIVLVTHHIEEAVVLADRIFIMGGIPSKIIGEVSVEIKRPRMKGGILAPECLTITNEIRAKIRGGKR